MFNPGNDPNGDLTQNPTGDRPQQNLDNVDENVSPESVAVRKKQLEGIFSKLIIFGLTLGTVLGLTAYYLLNRFGLTKKPYQLEQERIEQERIEREQESAPVEKTHNLEESNPQSDRFYI